jgi:cobalt-zinc-cadmium efflux system outer membrane protein
MLIPLVLLLLTQGPGDSVSLGEALAHARAVRGQATVAAAQVAEARAALRSAGAITNPTVSYSHSGAVPQEHFLFDQPLDFLLRRGPERSAARARIAGAQADSSLTMAELAREVRTTFYRALAAAGEERLVQDQAAQADSVARIAAARLRAGDVSLLEQEQAAQEAARARQTLSAAREAARVAEAALARAIAWAGANPPRAVGALDAGLAEPQPGLPVPDSLPAVRTAVAESAATAALARSASLTRIPLPTLQGGAEWNDPSQPGTLAVLGFALPLPLWQSGGGLAAEAAARARRAAALAGETRLESVRALRVAQIRLAESSRRARFARDSLLPQAAVLRGRAVRAYQAGETGILPVLDALRSEREVVLAAVQDQLAYQEALADWYALLGRVDE